MVATYVLGTSAALFIGILIGRLTVLDKYEELHVEKSMAARDGDERARQWLRHQARKPSAESHIQHLHAVRAMVAGCLRLWLKGLATPATGWRSAEELRAAVRAAAADNRLVLPGSFAAFLPPNARKAA